MSDTQAPQVSAPALPSCVGKKFNPDGSAIHFPGNTIVCHLSPESDEFKFLLSFREKLKPIVGSKVAWLPSASWHVTVFEGVCDKVRKPGLWPADLSLEASLDECNKLFAERLSGRPLEEQPPYPVKFNGDIRTHGIIGMQVSPVGEDLRQLRDKLSAILGIRAPIHDVYRFHLTLAYCVEFLSDTEKAAIEDLLHSCEEMPMEFKLGAPEYCFFDDMCEFKRQFYLGAQD